MSALALLVLALLAGLPACQPRAQQSPRERPRVRVAPGLARPVAGLDETASFVLPARWVVDFYGARQAGPYLAFGWGAIPQGRAGSPPAEADEEAARVATRAVAVVDTRTADLRIIPAIARGWSPSVVAGDDRWILVRERRQLPASACGQNPDCWSWALYAHELPDRTPHLLSASVAPETQTHMPEPRVEGDTFVWLQGEGPGRPLTLRRWVRGAPTAAQVIATVEEARASPFLSLSGQTAWLDDRDPAGGPPRLRAVGTGADARPAQGGAIWTFPTLAYFPVVAARAVAFVTEGGAAIEGGMTPLRSVRIAALQDGGGSLTTAREIATARDVWDLSWLDDRHLVIAGSEGVELWNVRAGRRVALISDPLATAARTGERHLVVVTRDRDRDVVRSYEPAHPEESD